MSRALTLPSPLQGWIDDFAGGFLMPGDAPTADFHNPEGEPALVSHDSVSWQVFKNPVTLLIGGIAAVLLELAEPRVGHGVWELGNFRSEPLKRLQRTGLAAMVTVYGPRRAALAMIADVNRIHGRVAGVTSSGTAYRADDPELLTWVQVTAAYGFLEAYAAFARRIGGAERDLYYAEAAPVAALYGASGAPASQAQAMALFRRMRPKLEPSSIIFDFLEIMRRLPLLPAAGRPAQALLVKAAVEILPHGMAAMLGIGPQWRLKSWERPLVKTLARTGDRILLRSSPAVQSCLRLGLTEDYLYRA